MVGKCLPDPQLISYWLCHPATQLLHVTNSHQQHLIMAQERRKVMVRSRYGEPAHPGILPGSQIQTDDKAKIRFRHPAYSDAENILISFAALDDGGVHHATAHEACAVLADFRWDGFFSLTPTGTAIECGPDDILTEPNYYFQVPHDHRYGVVANFDSSDFPHGRMPPRWLSEVLKIRKALGLPRETSSNNIVLARDVSCRITQCTLGTEGAHLLPKSEELWYSRNSMFQYSAWEERGTTDDPRNTLLLRSDIHTVFDTKRFCIVPKNGQWVTHVLYGSVQDELARRFHNVPLQVLRDIAVEFIFARFVYTIHALSPFTLSGGKRALLVIKPGLTSRERVEVTGLQYKTQLAPQSRVGSRTPSPSKRRRNDTAAEDSCGDDDEQRGRRRRRLSYETTSPSSLAYHERDSSNSSVASTLTDIPSDSGNEPANGTEPTMRSQWKHDQLPLCKYSHDTSIADNETKEPVPIQPAHGRHT